MKTTCIIASLALLAACGSQPEEKKEPAGEPQANTKPDSTVNCYRYATAADTVILKLVRIGENVTGTLAYQFKEKDSNKGTLQGSIKNDLLVADYTFMSEGTQSVRQVAFKQSGNTFTEGYGESVDANGVSKFKNLDSLDFSSSFKLQETACQ